MLDALFWCTGLVAWILIVPAGLTMLAADVHDRLVLKRGRNI